MPSIDQTLLLQLRDDYRKYSTFVETGTYVGSTVIAMEPYFADIYTVEISPKYHSIAQERYNQIADKKSNVRFLLGDSDKVFQTLLPTLKTANTVFFLDGHWSCEDTGQGSKQVPLLEEITHINSLFRGNAILIIDDFRLFETDTDVDWSNIKKDTLLSILQDRITDVYHLDSVCAKNDRMIVHIKAL